MHLCRKTTYTFSKPVPSGTFKGCGNHMKCSKKYVWIGFFFCLILGSLSHFFYQWSGDTPAVGLFSPVNESAWEHMKLVFFPVLLYTISARLFLKNAPDTLLPASLLGLLAGTLFIPVFFYTYSGILGFDIFWLDILDFILALLLTFYITCRCSSHEKIRKRLPLLLFLTFLFTAAFFYFTFQPPQLGIFTEP